MKKIILIIILLIPLVTALPELKVTPQTLELEVKIDTNTTFTLNVSNYGDMDLYNLTSSNIEYFKFPEISILEKANITQGLNASNETINIIHPTSKLYSFFVETDEIFDKDYVTTFSFFYKKWIDIEKTERNITINDSGFIPSYLEANQDDLIYITNTDDKNHTVTELSNHFNYNIAPNSFIVLNWTEIESIHFYDKISSFVGKINVTNKTEYSLVHSSNLDRTVPINLKSKYKVSNVTFSIFVDSFSMGHSETVINALNIVNNGDETAYNISFSADWTSFEPINFDLEASKNKIVYFNTTPSNITRTEHTNKTYNIEITAKGSNFESTTKSINVEINYNNFNITTAIDGGNIYYITDEGIADFCEKNKQFCLENPEDCPCPVFNITVEKIQEKEGEVIVGKDSFDRSTSILETWANEDTIRSTERQTELKAIKGKIQDVEVNVNNKLNNFGEKLDLTSQDIALLKNNTLNIGAIITGTTNTVKSGINLGLIALVCVIIYVGYLHLKKQKEDELKIRPL